MFKEIGLLINTDRVTNEGVLRRVEDKRMLINTVQKEKGNWLGHIVREKGLITTVLEGTVEGAKKRAKII